jgi:hypothetical protein
MKTLKEIADILQQARSDGAVTLRELSEQTGLTAVTLRGLLEAKTDPRLTTLMAVADQLGLEVMLVPQAVSASIARPAQPDVIEVPTLVGAALKRQRGGK